ncbi:MAG: putative metal-binding motif-containing protein [Myxococcales bacterium]|nr:putative metal-binding motif-containing protein [Myxococcales bacterium]
MKFLRARAVPLLGALTMAGCSLLVQPNEARLRDGGGSNGDGSNRPDAVDVMVVDGEQPDVVVVDTPTPDVPNDVPNDTPSACPLGCNDGVDCTDDRCNEALGRCEFTPNPTACATGLVCNPMMGGCVAISCTSNAMCDDSNACNGAETCDMRTGRCQGGTPLVCDDGDACNGAETCDARMGCQRATPLRCDDGMFCNGTETCDRARGCVPGAPPACDDRVTCTVDSCNETRRACDNVPNGMLCGAGQVCNPMMGCVTMGCTRNEQCDDGNVCNGSETCSSGVCNAGTPLRCDDGNRCNGTETCDTRMGCRPGTALVCDDGQLCNGTETCNNATGCVPGTAPNCRDGNVCTNDACDPAGNAGRGACVNTPIDADGDGFPAMTVGGMTCTGRDCNDGDRTANPGAMEVCNTRDDNCNGMIDEGLTCTMPPANDQCAAAQAITLTTATPTATVMGTTLNATSQVGSRCGGDGQPDVYYRLTVPSLADVRIEATPAGGTMVDPILQLVGAACPTGGGGVLACNDDSRSSTRASRLWVRALPLGSGTTRTIIVAVDSFNAMSSGAFTLTATLTTPVAAGGCGTGRFDLSQGGTVYHIVPAQTGTLSATCSPGGYLALGEQGYIYQGAMAGARITGAATGFRPLMTVRDLTNCGNERQCSYNGMNAVQFTTTQTSGTLVIDGIPQPPTPPAMPPTYQYAVEFVPQ